MAIFQDTAAVVSASSAAKQRECKFAPDHNSNSPRPMKFFLLDQDSGSQEIWHNCAESAGVAFQLVKYNDYCDELPQEAGILVIDKSVCGQDFVGQVDRLCRKNRRQQIIATGKSITLDQAVDLMRASVVAVFDKPWNLARLKKILPDIVQQAAQTIKAQSEYVHLNSLFSSLTARERQVLDMVLEGVHNRESAEQLGVSVRTVEARRAKVYHKLECSGLAELVRKIERMDGLKRAFAPLPEQDSQVTSISNHHLDRPAFNAERAKQN